MTHISVSGGGIPQEFFSEPASACDAPRRDDGVIGEFAPAFEARETRTGVRIQDDVPGVASRDLHVSLRDRRLIIWGQRSPAPRARTLHFLSYERTYGKFWRTFRLEGHYDVARVHAALENGVLTITLRKQRTSAASCIN